MREHRNETRNRGEVSGRHFRRRALPSLARFVRSEFVRHGTLVFAASMFVNALNYAFHFVVSRLLGVSDYGALSALVAAIALLSFPATILTTIVVKEVAELHALGDRTKVRRLADIAIGFTFTLAASTLVLTAVLRGSISQFLNLRDPLPVVIAGLALAITLMLPAVRGVLQGMQDFRGLGISMVIEALGKCGIGIGLAAAGFGTIGAVTGIAAGSLVGFLYALFRLGNHSSRREAGIELKLDFRRLCQTASGVSVSMLALTVLSFVDVILVKHFFDPHTAGLYGAVSLVGKVVLFLGGFVPTVLLPKATAVAQKGESPLWVIRQAAVVAGAIVVGTVLVAFFFPGRLLNLVAGPAFIEAAPLVFPYACAMSLLGAANVAAAYKVALHRFDFVVPLAAVAGAEIVGIVLMHRTLHEVVGIVLAGDLLGLAITAYGITAIHPRPATVHVTPAG